MAKQHVFQDEKGAWSMARVLLAAALVFTFLLIAAASLDRISVPEPAWVLLGTIFTGLLAWAAGPRMAQYIGPQMGAVASGIAAAVKEKRLKGTDDSRKDDERDA